MPRKSVIKDNVQAILEQVPATRDDNMLLTIEYYRRFHGTTDLVELARMTVPPIETIRRSRQWLQERVEALRGVTWDERQSHAGTVRNAFSEGRFGLVG